MKAVAYVRVSTQEQVREGISLDAQEHRIQAYCTMAGLELVTVDALTQTRNWDRAGVSLHLVDMGGQTLNTGSAMGRMFLTITAAFAELERNLISERTSAALQELKSQGVTLGAPALGQTPEERSTVELIVELREQELTLRQIAERLTADGHSTKRGGKWAPETVRKILRRERTA